MASTVLPAVLSIVTIGALFVIIPVVAAYLMIESEGLKRTLLGFIPATAQPKALKIMRISTTPSAASFADKSSSPRTLVPLQRCCF